MKFSLRQYPNLKYEHFALECEPALFALFNAMQMSADAWDIYHLQWQNKQGY